MLFLNINNLIKLDKDQQIRLLQIDTMNKTITVQTIIIENKKTDTSELGMILENHINSNMMLKETQISR